ncbi:pci domain-containing protein 2-like protein [Lasius niger]|uniref:Pci domain-containing protein 2-like protein n=1 Tax=Lasius niger TaxID=67767 RepID=A0A0J7KCY2_LASNI|nr:pci domain-containing protein 2-like protein [Lasius niger]
MDSYIMQIRRTWLNQDGEALADLLSLRHNHVSIFQVVSETAIIKAMEHLSAPLDDLVLCHLKAVSAMNKNDILTMYNYQSSAVQCLAKILQMQKEENWMLPVMNVMCLELRLSAIGAENSKYNKNIKQGEVLEKCAECLMACFRVCAADNRSSEEDTKRWGMLALINQLLKKKAKQEKRKTRKINVPSPRTTEMSIDQDWPSVWPGARTFHPASVPLPLRQGYQEKGAPPNKYANAELMKIPNFLHLTPPAIQRHCEALKQFCTKWPTTLEAEEECTKYFPIEIITSDYCYSSPTIRDPLARIRVESWEAEKSIADMEYFDWDTSQSRTSLVTLYTWPIPPTDYDYERVPHVAEYKIAVSDLINNGEDSYSIDKYKEAVKNLLNLKCVNKS